MNSGDTAWILACSALVLLMTPGVAFFYGGLVRKTNAAATMMHSFMTIGIVGVVWVLWGYSLAFGPDIGGVIGSLEWIGLRGVSATEAGPYSDAIPHQAFMIFQAMFAIITPALVTGAFAERMKFSAMLLFSVMWTTIVYAPVCHMAWSGPGGFFWDLGILDFAGGTVVHINAGVAALVAAIMIGKREGFGQVPLPPHSLTITVIGASMLWVGWFGFNAGSAVAANGSAGMAMLVTQVATAMAGLTWMAVAWIKHGKPSVLGIVTGAVAGLVAITPASGSVGPMGGLAIGFVSGLCCFWATTTLKQKLGYDDSLDAFGVHGIGGIVGAILTGVFASESLGGLGLAKESIGAQLGAQLISVIFTIVYSGVLSFFILKIVDVLVGLRVNEDEESQGLDLALHSEQGYNMEL